MTLIKSAIYGGMNEEFMTEQDISDYAERYCKTDRVVLMRLFNSIRYGKLI
ncbi:MAG: hypothetical protein K2N72_07910 [Oscillospiraceae bacterium]|nr:hypothetical protein [Oscillospiraceae bacterium]